MSIIIIDVAGDLDPTIQTPIDITVDAPSPLISSKVVNHLRSNNIGKMKFYIKKIKDISIITDETNYVYLDMFSI